MAGPRYAAALLVLGLGLGACGGAVELGNPALPAAERKACEALLAAVAGGLADRPRRTDVGAGLGAAYGDPAVVLRCGVDLPEGFDPRRVAGPDEPSPCAIVNGVGWYLPAEQAAGGEAATFTAIGYRPRISVTVPPEAQPESGAAALAQLAPVVKATLQRRPLDPTRQVDRVPPCA